MASTAARWVDALFPRVRVRQWVLTVPWRRRALFARRPELFQGVLAIALRHIERWYGRAVRRADGEGASVTAVQRFGSALNLNIHGHSLLADGVFVRDRHGAVVFRRATPGTKDVEGLVAGIARAAERWLRRQGYPSEEAVEADPEDALALLQSASLGGVVAVGPRAGCRVRRTQRLGGRERALPPRCAACAGYNLHAGVAVPARDREGLERLARYVLRPPVGKDRLERRGDRVAVRLKREWSDGTTEILVSPMELTEKLCALIPPPRAHTVLYHGIFAPRHRWRREVVPGRRRETPGVAARRRARKLTRSPASGGDGRDSWAELLRRVFGKDGFACARCGEAMTLRAVVVGEPATGTILRSLARGPPSRG